MSDKERWRDAKALRDENAALKAEVERLREALTEIAAFNDIWANGELFMCGSYSSFDEPHSVQTARAALNGGKANG